MRKRLALALALFLTLSFTLLAGTPAPARAEAASPSVRHALRDGGRVCVPPAVFTAPRRGDGGARRLPLSALAPREGLRVCFVARSVDTLEPSCAPPASRDLASHPRRAPPALL